MNRAFLVFLISLFMLNSNVSAVTNIENPVANLKQTSFAFAQVAKEVSPAVVNIQTDNSQDISEAAENQEEAPFDQGMPPPFMDLFRNFDPYSRISPGRREPVIRQGSGFIISSDGYIVTNNHLVEKTGKITVKLLDNKEYTAKIIGADPQSDIAVIKIDAKNLPTVKLGDSDAVQVGEWVVALGNPFGLSHSLSVGVLSAKGRNSVGITDYENFLQTDAAINPGNSGGPLLDLDGKVIGINTAIFSRSGGYMGIGFAIPINMAKGIIEQLMSTGSVVRGYLGVRIQELTKELADKFGIKDGKGILIAQIEKDGPADKAGLKQGDVIIGLDSKPVDNVGNFRNTVANNKPGSVHNLEVMRDKKVLKLKFTVGDLTKADLASSGMDVKPEEETISKLGISIQNLTADIAAKIDAKPGVGVVITKVKPGSLAEFAGLGRGAVILEVGRKKVNNVKEAKAEFEKASKAKSVLLLLQDQYGSRYVVLNFN